MLSLNCTIVGIGPYSQSKKLEEVKGKNEGFLEFENRIWRMKAHTAADGEAIVMPGHAIHQALVEGARKGRLQPRAAKSAREGLANRLITGIAILGDATTNMKLSKAVGVAINAHSNGKRGSGSRVTRLFPQWSPGWTASFDILVLDDSLTREDLADALKWAGLCSGLGRFRPENMGHNGRFTVAEVVARNVGIDDLKVAA